MYATTALNADLIQYTTQFTEPIFRFARTEKTPPPIWETEQVSSLEKLEFLVDADLELAAQRVAGEWIVAVVQTCKAWIAIGNVKHG